MQKKKPTYLNRRQKEEGSKRGLVWIGVALAVLVVLMAILLVFSN